MLEEHIVPLLSKWKVRSGLLGEQGAESIHAYFNRLKKWYNSIPDPLARLKQMMVEHYLQVAPDNTNIRPPPLKRKKTVPEE